MKFLEKRGRFSGCGGATATGRGFFMDKNIYNETMKKCPRYNYCSVPICPLDDFWKERFRLNPEPKCSLPKNTRIKLGGNLTSKGLLPKELSGLKTWNNKSDEDKTDIASKMAILGKVYRFAPRSENREVNNE